MNISEELTKTVANHKKAIEIGAEALEFIVDQSSDDGVFKDIPIVGWFFKSASATNNFRDRFLLKKILRFFGELENLDACEKLDFTEKTNKDKKFRRKVGDRIILALDRIDDEEKSEMLAKCFDSYIIGDLTYIEFSELIHIIDRSLLSHIEGIVSNPPTLPNSEYKNLVSSGLVDFEIDPNDYGEETPEVQYSISKIGITLQRVLQKKQHEHMVKLREQKQNMESFFHDEN